MIEGIRGAAIAARLTSRRASTQASEIFTERQRRTVCSAIHSSRAWATKGPTPESSTGPCVALAAARPLRRRGWQREPKGLSLFCVPRSLRNRMSFRRLLLKLQRVRPESDKNFPIVPYHGSRLPSEPYSFQLVTTRGRTFTAPLVETVDSPRKISAFRRTNSAKVVGRIPNA